MSDGNYTVTTSFYNGDTVVPWTLPERFQTFEEAKTYAAMLCFDAAEYDGGLAPIDTLFLSFKKYYQRVFWKTDIGYLDIVKQLDSCRASNIPVILTIIGHSLDETDKDIIMELFKYSTDIHILYYDSVALSKYVNNLINIYGKIEFDKLRYEKGLTFTSISEEIKDSAVLSKVFHQAVVNAMLK